MVLDYYNLREQPFGVTPDPRYLYGSDTHVEAVASLLYGIEAGRGFVALIAQPGMGKTTLLFHALNQFRHKTRVVFLFQTICAPADLLRAVLADLGVHDTHGSLIELQSKLNQALTEQSQSGKPLVILIDEAQNLDDSVLELVRMLSNFETPRQKLIQIILCGQPQFANKLASPDFVQLRQRISIIARLKPFSLKETSLYIGHRMRMAGYNADKPLFTARALELIAQHSEGIPRNINNLCFNALSLGCALKRKTIDCDIVREVIADLDLEPLCKSRPAAVRSEQDDAREIPISTDVPIFSAVASEPPLLGGRFPKLAVACAILVVLGVALFHSYPWLASRVAMRANPAALFQNYRRFVVKAAVRTSQAALFHNYSERVPKTTAPANRMAQPLISPASPSFMVSRKSQQSVTPNIILVEAGQSLNRICSENFGTCNSERLHEIQRLNPRLSNLDHIESGQKIRLPMVHNVSGATSDLALQPGSISPPERGRP